jgi:hypothetical protein
MTRKLGGRVNLESFANHEAHEDQASEFFRKPWFDLRELRAPLWLKLIPVLLFGNVGGGD